MTPGTEQFPIGSLVMLKYCPDSGEVGTVTGFERSRVVVHWPGWNREGHYLACSLLPAENKQ
jgi:hypothetical protein